MLEKIGNCNFWVFTEAATRGVYGKKVFLEISQNSQENTCARVSFLIKLQASGLRTHFSKNTFFKEHLWTTASIIRFLLLRVKNFLKSLMTQFWFTSVLDDRDRPEFKKSHRFSRK